jgi:integrase
MENTNKTMNKIKSLTLEKSDKEDLLVGIRTDGKKYSVRKHRKSYFMPDIWLKLIENLSKKGKLTAEVLIQTGARINEVRNIEERDIDYERNTIRLRVTKTKARKKGEERGSPRTIPINSHFIKKLKKEFKDKQGKIGILSTPAFNIALKKSLQKINVEDYYMYSAHSIRKTHGNWLKILSNLRMINCDTSEICLRLGHDYNTFLHDYGSSGVMDSKDVMLIKKILGDLYER